MNSENENTIQLIKGRMVDISKLSTAEIDDLLEEVNKEISDLEMQVEKEIFEEN